MNKTMLIFFAVLAVAVALYYAFPLKARWTVLLGTSLAFYLIISTYLAVFALTTAIGVYFTARAVDKRNRDERELTEEQEKRRKRRNKAVVAVTIIVNLAFLGFLKYFNFFGASFCSFLNLFGLDLHFRALKLILPLGISFYTLSAIGYLIDIHRKKYAAEKNFFKVLLFLVFFPSILEGPICRYDQTGTLMCEGHRADYKGMLFGLQRILWGLFKKMVIADRVYLLVRTVSSEPSLYSGWVSVLFILGYTLQLYADFSGFTDIALGTGQLFGIKLPENFRQPFFAKSAQEFWQRWHITLGTWLKEYVFYSVALSPTMMKFGKKIKKKHKNHFTKILPTGIALLAVWLCNGLWHGPEWKYIVYGLYYFVIIFAGMLCEPLFAKFYKKTGINSECIGLRVWRHIRTLLIIFVGETIFGAPTLTDAFRILGSVFRPYDGAALSVGLDWKEYIVLLFGAAVLLAVGILNERKINVYEKIGGWVLPARWAVYLAAVAVIVVFGAYGSPYAAVPFIYGNF